MSFMELYLIRGKEKSEMESFNGSMYMTNEM